MAHVIAAAWGVRGDVMPHVAIGAELARRGHDVTLVASPVYEAQAREAALSFEPFGTVEQYEALVEDAGLWHRSTYLNAAIKYLLPTVEELYRAIERTHRPGESVLLGWRPGAWIAREKLDLPLVVPVVSPGAFSRLDPMHPSRPFPSWANLVVRSRRGLRLLHWLKAERDKVRARLGRPVFSGVAAAFFAEIQRVRALAGLPERPASADAVRPALRICLWPPWFSPPQEDWPPDTRISGFPFHPRPPRTAGPLCEEGSRPVVFMRGSTASHQKAFFAEAVQCCLRLGRPGVLVTPHSTDVPSDLPSSVSHLRFAPLGELLRRSAAVVHHGGVGTMAYAFAAGIPQVVVPIVGDQFDLGYRMERLGVGSMLTRTTVNAGRLAREIRSLCGSESVRRRCEYLRDQVDPDAGCRLAADWIEELSASRQTRAAGRA